MRLLRILTAVTVSVAIAGCTRGKAPSGDDVVVHTVGQNLTVDQMAKLLVAAKVRTSVNLQQGMSVATLWASYQRLAFAVAHDDTLRSDVATAITPPINNERVAKLMDEVTRALPVVSATEGSYDSAAHGLYGVRHISILFPAKATPKQRDSVRAAAVIAYRSITPSNFSEMARKYSGDQRSAGRGGYVGVVPRTALNSSAAAVVAALKPGAISKLIQTSIGYEVIQRASWADAQADYTQAFARAVKGARDSVVAEHMADAAKLTITSKGPDAARAAVTNPVDGSHDTTTIATFDRGGRFTAADLIAWVSTMQPVPRVQVLTNLPLESDAVVTTFIRGIATHAVALRAADSAGIQVADSVRPQLVKLFLKDVVDTWKALGIAPEQLADSGKTPAEREQLAARRVESLIERGLAGQAQLPAVSVPIDAALNAKYRTDINSGALTRALDDARSIRAAADSGRAPKQGAAASTPKVPPI